MSENLPSHVEPTLVDPRLVTLATRVRSLRTQLDRVDDTIQLLDRDDRVEYVRFTTRMRGELDGLDVLVEQRAAGQ